MSYVSHLLVPLLLNLLCTKARCLKPGNLQLLWENRIGTRLALVHDNTNQRLLHCPVPEELFWKEYWFSLQLHWFCLVWSMSGTKKWSSALGFYWKLRNCSVLAIYRLIFAGLYPYSFFNLGKNHQLTIDVYDMIRNLWSRQHSFQLYFLFV